MNLSLNNSLYVSVIIAKAIIKVKIVKQVLLSRENNDLGSLDFEEDWRNYFTLVELVIVNLMHRIHMWVYFLLWAFFG